MMNIRSIWDNQTYKDDIIIKTRIEDIAQFRCFAATNHIIGNHIYIMELSKNSIVPEFKNFKFKGLRIEVLDYDNIKEFNIFLLDNQLKDIFSLFIEDILLEIKSNVTENEALITTSNVVLKWKKLFDKINFKGLTIEQQKGLIGELLLLNSFIDENYPIDNLLQSWTGPDSEDKDFLFGSIGFEVKFTSSKTPKITVTSERQLDNQNLTKLFLVLFATEKANDLGFSLNSIINQIRSKISNNHNAINAFNDKLLIAGYNDEDSENYNSQYALKNIFKYLVNNEFPKLTSSDLPNGIYNTIYNIELSAIEPYLISPSTYIELL